MIESSHSLYQLIILSLITRAGVPLSGARIADFLVSGGYTNYFRMQEILADMLSAGLLSSEKKEHLTHFSATAEGEKAITYYGSGLSGEIREEIDRFLSENRYQINPVTKNTADYRWLSGAGYEVRCTTTENGVTLIDLKLTVPSEEAAIGITKAWKNHSSDAYIALLGLLSEDTP